MEYYLDLYDRKGYEELNDNVAITFLMRMDMCRLHRVGHGHMDEPDHFFLKRLIRGFLFMIKDFSRGKPMSLGLQYYVQHLVSVCLKELNIHDYFQQAFDDNVKYAKLNFIDDPFIQEQIQSRVNDMHLDISRVSTEQEDDSIIVEHIHNNMKILRELIQLHPHYSPNEAQFLDRQFKNQIERFEDEVDLHPRFHEIGLKYPQKHVRASQDRKNYLKELNDLSDALGVWNFDRDIVEIYGTRDEKDKRMDEDIHFFDKVWTIKEGMTKSRIERGY